MVQKNPCILKIRETKSTQKKSPSTLNNTDLVFLSLYFWVTKTQINRIISNKKQNKKWPQCKKNTRYPLLFSFFISFNNSPKVAEPTNMGKSSFIQFVWWDCESKKGKRRAIRNSLVWVNLARNGAQTNSCLASHTEEIPKLLSHYFSQLYWANVHTLENGP